MIKKLKSAIDDIQNDLTSYKTADSQIKSVSNHIDEANVNTNRLIALVEQKMRDDKDLIKSFMEKGLSGAITGLSELLGLEGYLKNYRRKEDYIEIFNEVTDQFSKYDEDYTDEHLMDFTVLLVG